MPVSAPLSLPLPIRFPALDGVELGGVVFAPVDKAPVVHAVLINCGGGIRAEHYRHFAQFLAENGVAVVTYDYRGIGRSRPKRMRSFDAVVEDWSECDCGGAIAEMRKRYPEAEALGLGHSVGAMMFGGAPNASQLARFVFVGAHTGYVGDYRRGYRLPMALLWHGIMPLMTRMVGFFPGRMLHLGDDIPRGVALQWAGRRSAGLGRSPELTDGKRANRLVAHLAGLAGAALVISVTDDAFATEDGTRRLMGLFPRLEPVFLRCHPADVGLARIGHFGFFRRSAATLWPKVLAYIMHVPSSAGSREGLCRPPGRGMAFADGPLS